MICPAMGTTPIQVKVLRRTLGIGVVELMRNCLHSKCHKSQQSNHASMIRLWPFQRIIHIAIRIEVDIGQDIMIMLNVLGNISSSGSL